MGVGKSMKTFISAMTEQIGMGGYDGKIKSTPMGPFKWNDLTQLWENVNNGMVMNNVSFQDMFMMDYDTLGSDSGINPEPEYNWGNIISSAGLDPAQNYVLYASTTGATPLVASANTVTFNKQLTLKAFVEYFISGGATYENGISIRKTDFQPDGSSVVNVNSLLSVSGATTAVGSISRILAGKAAGGWTLGNCGYIYIQDITRGITLDVIPFQFTKAEPEPP